jgi:hypothetical protein
VQQVRELVGTFGHVGADLLAAPGHLLRVDLARPCRADLCRLRGALRRTGRIVGARTYPGTD